jgi:hypothetical protein
VASAEPNTITSLLARPRLLEIFHGERIVLDLGRTYRALIPGESERDTLARAIMGGTPGAASFEASPAAVTERIHHQVQYEFATGATVTLKGWVLSVTEARQCALCSLLRE